MCGDVDRVDTTASAVHQAVADVQGHYFMIKKIPCRSLPRVWAWQRVGLTTTISEPTGKHIMHLSHKIMTLHNMSFFMLGCMLQVCRFVM